MRFIFTSAIPFCNSTINFQQNSKYTDSKSLDMGGTALCFYELDYFIVLREIMGGNKSLSKTFVTSVQQKSVLIFTLLAYSDESSSLISYFYSVRLKMGGHTKASNQKKAQSDFRTVKVTFCLFSLDLFQYQFMLQIMMKIQHAYSRQSLNVAALLWFSILYLPQMSGSVNVRFQNFSKILISLQKTGGLQCLFQE